MKVLLRGKPADHLTITDGPGTDFLIRKLNLPAALSQRTTSSRGGPRRLVGSRGRTPIGRGRARAALVPRRAARLRDRRS